MPNLLLPFALTFALFAEAPSSKIYSSPTGAFQFNIPPGFEISKTFSPVCDDGAAACLMYPSARYRGTNFDAAAFQVKTIDAKTPSACTGHVPDTLGNFELATKEPTRLINGIRFTHGTGGDAAMSHHKDVDVYYGFSKGKCYELSLTIASSSFQVHEKGSIKEFTARDSNRVVADLKQVLDSFKIQH